MTLISRLFLAPAAIAAIVLFQPAAAAGQAFTPPQGVGSITVAWQLVQNTGHRLSDGINLEQGQSLTTSALVEVDYGVTDRMSATFGIPYVFGKYTGDGPPISGLPHDTCRCWNSAFQDLSLSARYRLGDDRWALTPNVAVGAPSHNYEYVGEAVVGRNLRELQLGIAGALKLGHVLPKASVQGSYTYAFVQRPIDEIRIDRSNARFEFGYGITRGIYVRGDANWQRTNGGLRVGSPTGSPFPFPGELNTPERYAQRDRLVRVNYWHAGAGISFPAGRSDIFVSFTKYISGTDTHNGQAYTVGSTWYFDRSR